MRKTIYVTSVVFSFSLIAPAQENQKPARTNQKKEAILHIEVENGKTLDLAAKDLAKFARREIKAKGRDEKEPGYIGFNPSDVLLSSGAKNGAWQIIVSDEKNTVAGIDELSL